ncbi:MBL fold metallo-hydrolase [Chiayiivirga flava]|uniref:Glyoxylase-like metal-dependent hydrolase (Beta-lactamase superfamily II) n=1 Tax=Chiayiivirga flava TaxID=659595 RepID=A0A7W8D200_9GAMM|nr:MBL fold metallo-hydrolase [Chiayiivirga flava]MBB5206518.1 glyoxylase-like metal-dependent hydrolase (beta-lactamase superfamily II) [Chiayiivirga flava]
MTQQPATDAALAEADAIVRRALHTPRLRPEVRSFFDAATFTASHVIRDPSSGACAIVDSVLDFDPASGRTATRAADAIVEHVRGHALTVQWQLETHAHADHLSAAPYLQAALGGRLAIGDQIVQVQAEFGRIFNAGDDFARDGSQFDHLFADGERFGIGALEAIALHVPGHTPACLAYVIGDAVFPGDTLFMPDYGTARCDFPGGAAGTLYRSIRRLLSLPDAARVFLCHDYKAPGRDAYAWETTIGAERTGNVHVRDGVGEVAFVAMREARDATLPVPRLLLPSVQVNMRAGRLPNPDDNGVRYLRLPLDLL